MVSTQENIFDAVKKAGTRSIYDFVNIYKDYVLDLNMYSSQFRDGFNFNQFSSFKDSFEFIEEIRKNNPSNSSLKYVKKPKYQSFDTLNDSINTTDKDFVDAKDLTKNIIDNIDSFVNIGGVLEKDKIKISEDKRGVFDFSLASLGLYRPIEFFSKKLFEDIQSGKTQNPFKIQGLADGVVNPNFVSKNTFGDEVIYLFKNDNQNYECERRQRGATSVFNTYSDECYLASNQDGIVLTYNLKDKKVFNGRGRTKLKYASSNKKSYLVYNKKDDNVKYVDIFIPINLLVSTENDRRFLTLIPPLLVAGALEKNGISVRISAMRIGTDESILTSISIPVKDYNVSIEENFNEIFNLLGQRSVGEEFFAFFKTYAQANSKQTRQQKNEGAYFSELGYNYYDYMIEMMQRYKNWAKENVDKDFINTKVTNENFQFAINSPSGGVSDVVDYKFIAQNIHKILFDFYYYIDFLAIEMIPLENLVGEIYQRFNDDKTFNSIFTIPKSNEQKKKVIKSYIIRMLVEKYATTKGGMYEDTEKQESEKFEKFKSKSEVLNDTLNNL